MSTTQFDLNSVDDYRRFLAIKSLPKYRITGRTAWYPDEYRTVIDGKAWKPRSENIELAVHLFDYQRDIAKLVIHKRKFAVFAECGYGKTMIYFEFARHALKCIRRDQGVMFVSPLMVVDQTLEEFAKWYPSLPVEQVSASDLPNWTSRCGGRIGVTNFDAITEHVQQGNVGALIIDESSLLKSHYGKWGGRLIEIGKGLDWKLAGTGTPAPNDRIEYANHAVLLDAFPTVNAFLARFFVNRGDTQNRWELRPHGLEAFYRELSHWSIFLSNPATYGWQDNCGTIPPIRVEIVDVDTTPEQDEIVRKMTRQLFVTQTGGITKRSVLSQIAKGNHRGEDVPTRKYDVMREHFEREPERSTIIWCRYNDEQDKCASAFPGVFTAAN